MKRGKSSFIVDRALWIFWSNWTSEDHTRFEDALRRSKDINLKRGAGGNITALRSASPVVVAALDDLPELHSHYWKHGTTDTDLNAISSARNGRPSDRRRIPSCPRWRGTGYPLLAMIG